MFTWLRQLFCKHYFVRAWLWIGTTIEPCRGVFCWKCGKTRKDS